jgi:hypothetical protein
MQGIKQTVQGNKLILEIDLTQNLGPSKSGKTLTVASSGGFQKVEGAGSVSFSLNVNKKPG